MLRIETFSIVACDLDAQAWGVAVASKFLAVGAVVSWAQAGVGAIATQALANVRYGPDGLGLLADGLSAEETLAALLARDPGAPDRQVGLVDARGQVAAHTGARCFAWAGHHPGHGFTCQGNILAGPQVLDAMAQAYLGATGELADRLVEALAAGDAAGGDRRGKQSAAVLVVRPAGGYGGDNDRYLDLRVDDDPEPIPRLGSLVASHHIFFGQPQPEDLVPVDQELARELQHLLQRLGYYTGQINGQWDTTTQQAFWALVGNENLEERWTIEKDPERIDQAVVRYLRQRFS